jgi:hypothetical protein
VIHPDLRTVVECIVVNVADHVGAVYVSQFSPTPTLADAAAFLSKLDPEIVRLELWRGVQMSVYLLQGSSWVREPRTGGER